MRVLILGGGRFQGRRAAEMLVEAGHAVIVVNRSTPIPGARCRVWSWDGSGGRTDLAGRRP